MSVRLDGICGSTISRQAAATGTDGNYIFGTLRTDGWSLDAIGYNFRYTVPSSVATFEGGHTYRYEFKIPYIASAGDHPAGNAYVIAEIKHKPVFTE